MSEYWEFGCVVVDASTVIAVVSGDDPRGSAATARIVGANLIAPTILPYEVTNVVRRRWAGGVISLDDATTAMQGFAELNVEYFQWAMLADRVWQLRGSLSSYDASYIALAEIMRCPLMTADAKLAAMAPATCQVELI